MSLEGSLWQNRRRSSGVVVDCQFEEQDHPRGRTIDGRATRQMSDENPMKPSKKALFARSANKAFEMETTRIELATSGLQSRRSPS